MACSDQVPIYKLLEKYNNLMEVELKTYDATYLKKYEIPRLPKYLILAIKRFAFYIIVGLSRDIILRSHDITIKQRILLLVSVSHQNVLDWSIMLYWLYIS